MTPHDHDQTSDGPAPALTDDQQRSVSMASWAIGARDLAIEDGDASAAFELDSLVTDAIHEAGLVGVDQARLAAEIDYPGGAPAMVDPPELGDPEFRPRPDLAFDPTLAATTPAEATQWLTARLGSQDAAYRVVAELQAANLVHDPSSGGWGGSLSPHELEYLAQGGARPGETFDEAMRRIETTRADELIPANIDGPIPYQLTEIGQDAAPDSSRDEPAVVATWAPVGPDEQTLTPREAAARLTDQGLTDDQAAAAVTAYLAEAGHDTGTDMRGWGLDSHDLDAITNAADAHPADPVIAADAIPGPRPAPDHDERARRAQLARWHTDDHTARSAEEGLQR